IRYRNVTGVQTCALPISCIYVETPINPTMELVNLKAVVAVAKRHNIRVVVDNTFSSPYLQKPLTLGVDYVLHSATKYINGHGDRSEERRVGKESWRWSWT